MVQNHTQSYIWSGDIQVSWEDSITWTLQHVWIIRRHYSLEFTHIVIRPSIPYKTSTLDILWHPDGDNGFIKMDSTETVDYLSQYYLCLNLKNAEIHHPWWGHCLHLISLTQKLCQYKHNAHMGAPKMLNHSTCWSAIEYTTHSHSLHQLEVFPRHPLALLFDRPSKPDSCHGVHGRSWESCEELILVLLVLLLGTWVTSTTTRTWTLDIMITSQAGVLPV